MCPVTAPMKRGDRANRAVGACRGMRRACAQVRGLLPDCPIALLPSLGRAGRVLTRRVGGPSPLAACAASEDVARSHAPRAACARPGPRVEVFHSSGWLARRRASPLPKGARDPAVVSRRLPPACARVASTSQAHARLRLCALGVSASGDPASQRFGALRNPPMRETGSIVRPVRGGGDEFFSFAGKSRDSARKSGDRGRPARASVACALRDFSAARAYMGAIDSSSRHALILRARAGCLLFPSKSVSAGEGPRGRTNARRRRWLSAQ
jgi:hypothetical protein